MCVLRNFGLLPYYKEHILALVRKMLEIFKSHHRRRAFDCVHYSEYLVDILLREYICILCSEKNFIELFKQRIGFKYVHFEHGFHAGFNLCHIQNRLSLIFLFCNRKIDIDKSLEMC